MDTGFVVAIGLHSSKIYPLRHYKSQIQGSGITYLLHAVYISGSLTEKFESFWVQCTVAAQVQTL